MLTLRIRLLAMPLWKKGVLASNEYGKWIVDYYHCYYCYYYYYYHYYYCYYYCGMSKIAQRLLKIAKDHPNTFEDSEYYPTIFEGYRRFQKIIRRLSNISEDYPKISENYRRLPKIDQRLSNVVRRIANIFRNLQTILFKPLIISSGHSIPLYIFLCILLRSNHTVNLVQFGIKKLHEPLRQTVQINPKLNSKPYDYLYY